MTSVLKRGLFIVASATVMSVVASGSIALRDAQREYYGVCSKLTGVPGFLQKAGFFQGGTCVAKPGGSLCSAGSACTTAGKAGACKNTAKPGGTPICSCVATVTPVTPS